MLDILNFKQNSTKWLSNMALVKIEYDDIVYPSVENFYQAMKYKKSDMLSHGITVREYISQLSPYDAKKYSKYNKLTSKTFEDNKLKIMYYGQYQKYSKDPYRRLLKNTGNAHIEEGNNWNDLFWGVDITTRNGLNHLGKIIMKIRDDFSV